MRYNSMKQLHGRQDWQEPHEETPICVEAVGNIVFFVVIPIVFIIVTIIIDNV